MKAPHIITLILWAFGIVNLFEPFNGWFFYVASAIFYLLLIAHVVECFIFREKILKSSDSPFVGFMMTLLFGVILLFFVSRFFVFLLFSLTSSTSNFPSSLLLTLCNVQK